MRKYKQVHRKEIVYSLDEWKMIEERAASVLMKTRTFIKRMSFDGHITYFYTNAVNCLPNAKDAYLAMKTIYEHFSSQKFNEPLPKQGKGRVKAIHYIQSFDLKDNISPELAHQIARAFTRKAFGDSCQVVIATHNDKSHIHNHIIINTYNVYISFPKIGNAHKKALRVNRA